MLCEKRYEVDNDFVLRTPLLPLNFFYELTQSKYSDEEFLQIYLDKPNIKEAIQTTSPVLYEQLIKWSVGKPISEKKKRRLKISLVKYLTRMSTRPTPYGIMAGCCTGSFDSKTKIVLSPKNEYMVTVRDNAINQYKDSKLRSFESLLSQKNLIWLSNTSLYKLGGNWRYMEIHVKLKAFEYTSEELSGDDFLDSVIYFCRKGVNMDQLFNHLKQMSITHEDSIAYIQELVYNQIIEPFDSRPLLNINKQKIKVHALNQGEFKDSLNEARIHDCSYDLFPSTKSCHLNTFLKKDIVDLMHFMVKISSTKKNERLERFKRDFVNRYGEQELPLTKVLDPEFGLEFLKSDPFIGDSQLLSELNIKRKKEVSSTNLIFDKTSIVLNDKMKEVILNNSSIIELKDQDFESTPVSDGEMPNTFFALVQVAKIQGKDTLHISRFNGGNASKIISRFGFGDSKIQQIIDKTINHETELLNSNQVYAEIIHHPSQKSSNIVKRFTDRVYEIPYLGISSKDWKYQIGIEDLMVSINQNRVKLRSKRLNQEVISVLTSAHYYKNSSLPIYQFLCDIGFYNEKTSIGFDWGPLRSIYRYLPRVVYKSIIVSKAKWIFKRKEIPIFSNTKISSWRKKHKLPQRLYLVNGDNKLLIDFESKLSIEVFYDEIKAEKWVELEEFIFGEGTPLFDLNEDCYANEFLVFLKNS